jgi:ATP-dependent Clp protease ATP-binding subunit ClpA
MLDLYQAGFGDASRPVGNALFLGPTGTGKTCVVEAFAEAVIGNKKACLRIDCAEFQHSHEIAKLVGSPPGYLGHRETKPFLNQAALDQYHTLDFQLSIVLFDEIEKASDALWSLLLGILDNATLTCGDNSRVDFRRTIIVMTSNLGAREMANRGIGFVEPTDEKDNERLEKIAVSAAKRKFSPEFMNRIQNIVTFKTLTQEEISKILDIELQEMELRIGAASLMRPIDIGPRFLVDVSPKAKKVLIAEGYDTSYGARYLKRTIERRIQRPLAKMVTSDQVHHGDIIVVDDSGGKDFDFYVHNPKEIQ